MLAPEFRAVEAAFDLAIVLRSAPELLIAALVGVHDEGERVKDAAHRLGVSRFWIARESNALFSGASAQAPDGRGECVGDEKDSARDREQGKIFLDCG